MATKPLTWPSWREFISGLRTFEQNLSTAEIKGAEYFRKFQDKHPILDVILKKSIAFLPSPLNQIVQGIYDEEDNPVDGSTKVYEYLKNLESLGPVHYDRIMLELKDIKTDMAKEETQIQIKEVLVSTGDVLKEKLKVLKNMKKNIDEIKPLLHEIKKEVKTVDTRVDVLQEQLNNLQHAFSLIALKLEVGPVIKPDKKIEIPEEVLLKLKQYEVENEKINKVLEQLNQTPKIDPNDLILEANLFYYANEYYTAIRLYDLILKNNPKNVDTLHNKGLSLFNLGKHEEAIIWYDKALEVNPRYVVAIYNKGTALDKLGKHEEAIIWYDKALEVNSKEVSTLFNKGLSLTKLGKLVDASVLYDKILDINSKHVDALFLKGFALFILYKYEEAKLILQKLIEINPNSLYVTKLKKLLDSE